MHTCTNHWIAVAATVFKQKYFPFQIKQEKKYNTALYYQQV